MASTPDSKNIGIELQAAGENLNTWGDPKLNNALRVLSNLASKFHTIAITGNYTVSETNYSTSNDTEVALIMVTGALSAAANFVMPSRQKRLIFWNATTGGYAVTPKLAASTGVSVPMNGIVMLATDGSTDVFNVGPTHAGTTTQSTAANAYALWGAVETAIAAAGGLAAPFILWSGTDTTPGYGGQKVTAGTGINIAVQNPGANENGQISVDTTKLAEFLALTGTITATLSSGTTAMTAKRRYRISSTATGTLPTMTDGDFVIVELTVGAGVVGTVGRNSQTIDGNAADDTYTGDGGSTGPVVLYKYTSAGAVTSELIGGVPL